MTELECLERIEVNLTRMVNDIIEEAIEHGGDSGGAYCTNTEGLVKAMKRFLNWCGYKDRIGIMNEDGILRFYRKSDIVE